MESRAFALITGAFVLGLLACLIAWAQWLAREPLARTQYRVVSTIPVAGLNPEAQVRYRGMGVGRVNTIGLDPRDKRRILIGIEVDDAIPVTRGTYAQLGMEGITGIAYVHLLDEGKDQQPAPAAADGVSELSLRPSFMDTISDGAEGTVREARELIAALHALLNEDNRRRIGSTLVSLEKIATSLEATSQRLPGVIDRNDARLGAWLGEDNRKLARESLERARDAFDRARDALDRMNEAMASLPELTREAKQLAQDARGLVAQIGKLSAEAQSGAGAVREDTLPRVNALADTVERGAQRVGRLAAELDRQPDSLLWGRKPSRPGPGEPGFAP